MCLKQRSQCLLPANYTQCAAQYGQFCVRQRHAVHQHWQIYLLILIITETGKIQDELNEHQWFYHLM